MDTLMTDNYPFGLGVEETARVTGFVPTNTTPGHLVNHIDPSVVIDCPDVQIGVGVTIQHGTRITAKRLRVGDFAFIGDNVTLRVPDDEIAIGDYTRINALTYGGGRKSLRIGRNVYLGRGCYLDSNGGLTLEDNTLAGAGSQLWTHVQGGDLTYGGNPKLHAEWPLVVRKDAWLVGRVAVCHAQEIGARAVVMAESNVLADVPEDTTWAGNPARDITDKFGRQFSHNLSEWVPDWEKRARLATALEQFEAEHPEHAGKLWAEYATADASVQFFDAINRTYTKRRTAAEVAFIRYCLAHDLGKFVPTGEE